MPKRNNPFGDVSSLQLKTHIGSKEVDKGVDEKTRMQSVFDKTNELLFSGMKSYMKGTEMNNNTHANFGIDHVQAGVKSDHFKQMHIDKNCQLVSNDIEMDSCESAELNAMEGFHFDFGRTPSEHSPPGFVSAASLLSPHKTVSCGSNNVFEKMRQAQMNIMPSNSNFNGRACHSCTRPVQSRDVMKCQFCENYMCSPCTRQCSGCFLHFCQLCSILNYNQAKERAFCFGCSGK